MGRQARQYGTHRHRPHRRWLLAAGLPVLMVAGLVLAAQTTGQRVIAAVIPVRGMIDDIMRDSVERRLGEAQAAGATVIIFEMDTPGGLVTSALDICRLIKNVPAGVRTVAWIHPQAYSAGAMISVACNEIWMSPSSSIGDCAPIMVVPMTGVQELGETERAKAESPILQEFRDSAARNGYDPLLSRAMVVVGEEVWWLESVKEPGNRRFVDAAEKKKLIDDLPDDQRDWKLVERYGLPGSDRTVPVAQPVDRANELLTMSQFDAVAFGFARGIATDLGDLAARLELTTRPIVLEISGWEKFAAWLNSPLVRGILLVIVLIGGYVEFQSPGLILPGVTALVALAVFLAAPYAAGLAGIWTILVLVLGLILLAIEIFVLPGFGVAGVLGILLILAGIVGTFVPAEPNLPPLSLPSLRATWNGLLTGIKVLVGSLVVSGAGILLLIRYLPQSRVASGVLTDNPKAEALAVPNAHPDVARVGDIGVVTADLRPGGQARFGDEIVDVHSQSGYVEAGTRVQVVRREGMEIFVRPVSEEQQP